MFGTLYMARDRWPEDFGTYDAVPEGLLRRLAYPFQNTTVTAHIPREHGTWARNQ